MSAWTKWLRSIAFGVVAAAAVLVGARLILTPIQGDVLVLASAQQPDQLASSRLELHSSSGWTTLGSFPRVPVPEAPRTVTLVEARAPVGSYDSLRLGSLVLPVRVSVQQNVLASVLIGVSNGHPAKDRIYAGSDSVSLGLNELSGQLKIRNVVPVPVSRAVDAIRAVSPEPVAALYVNSVDRRM